MERRKKNEPAHKPELASNEASEREAAQHRMNKLPASMRKYMDKRIDAVVKQYPSILDPNAPRPSAPGMSVSTRLDILFLIVMGFVVALLLYSQYNINVFNVVFNALKQVLDPGLPPDVPTVSLSNLTAFPTEPAPTA
eukprot:TRINITY_DN7616_c0_g1_i1.p1 TRINITY_DN7616_c0_g1~~TRINITY_DN7616_c0_g1_i1.p1  ORF type:complete len:138 (-),score=11.87 TRINITY_DN7616_c0_g1_i1:713-1126(-)